MEIFFWVCLAAIAYPYAIYPALLIAINRLAGRKAHAPADRYEPTVTVILPVHNEARRIEARLRNLAELDYPQEKVQILVIGDACTDYTLERAARFDRVTTIPQSDSLGAVPRLVTSLVRPVHLQAEEHWHRLARAGAVWATPPNRSGPPLCSSSDPRASNGRVRSGRSVNARSPAGVTRRGPLSWKCVRCATI